MLGWWTIVAGADTRITRPYVQVALLRPHIRRQHQMAAIIPTNDHALLTLVAKNAEGGGSEREEPASLRRQAKPTRGEYP